MYIHKKMMDLHNHTVFSDGENTVEEIIKNALKYNIDLLGISDHFHLIEDLEMYFRIIKYFSKMYSSQVQVFAGIEIDITKFHNLKNTTLIKEADYILIENLEYVTDLNKSLQIIKSNILKYDKIIGLAHINFSRLIEMSGENGFKYVLDFMQENGIWWEINSNITTEFYDKLIYHPSKTTKNIINIIEDYDIDIIAGSDTHSLEYYDFNRLKDANDFHLRINNS